MKLFYAPNSCAMAIHLILEEIGKPYDLAFVNFAEAAQYKPEFLAISPKSKVPALQRDDGSILTELPAIAWYLARLSPEANLIPAGIEGEARTLELLDYITATIHMRGYTRLYRPATFTPSPADEPKVLERGREMVSQGLDIGTGARGAKISARQLQHRRCRHVLYRVLGGHPLCHPAQPDLGGLLQPPDGPPGDFAHAGG
jgi:glutathione S-transferase